MHLVAFDASPVELPGGGRAAARTSDVVVAAPFVALLPSWNLDVPPGAHAVVQVRVRATAGARWSPWLLVGEWGRAPERVPAAWLAEHAAGERRFDGGHVAIDHLVLERPAGAAQLRAVVLDGSSGGSSGADGATTTADRSAAAGFELRRAALCFSGDFGAASDARDGASAARPRPVLLDVPTASQRAAPAELAPRICSPTSLAMVLGFHGVEVEPLSVAARAYDARHDLYGNWPHNVQAAWSFGVPGVVTRFERWQQVERAFAEGLPIVASIGVRPGQLTGAPYTSTPGHLIVLCGFDARGDVIVNDPAARENVRRTYRRSELDTVWLERGGTAYLLEPPPP